MSRSRVVLALMSFAALLGIAGACGDDYGASPDLDAGTEGGTPDDADVVAPDAAADAGVDASLPDDGSCAAEVPFKDTTLAVLTELVAFDTHEEGIRLTADGLSAYLARGAVDGGAQNLELFVTSRATPAGTFQAPTPVPNVNGASFDTSPSETSDRLHLFFNGRRSGESLFYRADRLNSGVPYGAPQPLTINLDTGVLTFPYVLPDGTAMYFSGNRGLFDAGTEGNIYRASLGTDLTPTDVALVTEIASQWNERAPVVTPDELTMYFASNATGNQDVYVTSRATKSAAWGTPRRLTGAMNLSSEELPTFVTADGCTLYFQRLVQGQWDLFRISKR